MESTILLAYILHALIDLVYTTGLYREITRLSHPLILSYSKILFLCVSSHQYRMNVTSSTGEVQILLKNIYSLVHACLH